MLPGAIIDIASFGSGSQHATYGGTIDRQICKSYAIRGEGVPKG